MACDSTAPLPAPRLRRQPQTKAVPVATHGMRTHPPSTPARTSGGSRAKPRATAAVALASKGSVGRSTESARRMVRDAAWSDDTPRSAGTLLRSDGMGDACVVDVKRKSAAIKSARARGRAILSGTCPE